MTATAPVRILVPADPAYADAAAAHREQRALDLTHVVAGPSLELRFISQGAMIYRDGRPVSPYLSVATFNALSALIREHPDRAVALLAVWAGP